MDERWMCIGTYAGRGIFRTDKGRTIDVTYSLSEYQEMKVARPGTPRVPGMKEVRGIVTPTQGAGLLGFGLIGDEGTLELKDGRTLRCFISDSDGTISAMGGIHERGEEAK